METSQLALRGNMKDTEEKESSLSNSSNLDKSWPDCVPLLFPYDYLTGQRLMSRQLLQLGPLGL